MNTLARGLALACLAALAGGGCSERTLEGECRRDGDCAAYQRCDTLDYRCVCASDEACADGEYCNPSGSCQVLSGCVSNEDCGAGSFCDVGSGQCVAAGTCSLDRHCDIGMICEGGACHLGCRTTADCELLEREVCVGGSCLAGRCEQTDYCPFGQFCVLAERACQVDPTQPYCVPGCSPICAGCTDKTQGPCGDPANLCSGQNPTYCLVACQAEDDCPSGYDCVNSVYPHTTCAEDVDCAAVRNTCGAASHRCALNQQPCDGDAECHDFGTLPCVGGYCVLGLYCVPPGGCRAP
ncbi:MAG TPA: hypothetical protein PK668_07565 [Myxococcota bacterium]|nr:hypothetical protein [Myxococcota bacterium]HRY92297.1 hypothetical protein [Myxococcota bacterium]HSA23626.1 hypothetical protein [Myxococcota bacterium]